MAVACWRVTIHGGATVDDGSRRKGSRVVLAVLCNSATAGPPWMTITLEGQPQTNFALQFGHSGAAMEVHPQMTLPEDNELVNPLLTAPY